MLSALDAQVSTHKFPFIHRNASYHCIGLILRYDMMKMKQNGTFIYTHIHRNALINSTHIIFKGWKYINMFSTISYQAIFSKTNQSDV